ncbi:18885_t:CDS:1, partial [Racocetra persica]
QAAVAITRLANFLARGRKKKSLIKIKLFREDGIKDPVDWINEFEQTTTANN